MEDKNHKVSVMNSSSNDGKTDLSTNRKQPTVTEIEKWLTSYVAELLETDPENIDATVPFERHGLDSSAAVGLTCDLEDWLGVELDPTLAYDYPTIEALASHLAKICKAK